MQPILNDYNTGLCDCCDDFSSLLDGWCCGYCQSGRQYNMLTKNIAEMDTMICAGTFFADSCLCFGFALAALRVVIRGEARVRLGITTEDTCGTCLRGFFCGPCSTCQIYRELSIRGRWTGGVCVSSPYVHPSLAPPVFAPSPAFMVAAGNAMPQSSEPIVGQPVVYVGTTKPQGDKLTAV